jgi:hypothetical protein
MEDLTTKLIIRMELIERLTKGGVYELCTLGDDDCILF